MVCELFQTWIIDTKIKSNAFPSETVFPIEFQPKTTDTKMETQIHLYEMKAFMPISWRPSCYLEPFVGKVIFFNRGLW